MANGDRSNVRDQAGRTTHVDIDNGIGQTERWQTYGPGSDTPKQLVGVQNHDDGHFRECAGTDIFGSPVYKK